MFFLCSGYVAAILSHAEKSYRSESAVLVFPPRFQRTLQEQRAETEDANAKTYQTICDDVRCGSNYRSQDVEKFCLLEFEGTYSYIAVCFVHLLAAVRENSPRRNVYH